MRPDRSRGVVFQEPALFPWRTVFENVSIALKADAIGRAERRERVLTQLERVGLAAFASHYPTQLSGGMKQRVMLARALAMGSRILLMDEPFAALDALTRETMQEQLLDLWQATGMTVIFVTHSIEEAVYLSQRVLVLSSRPGRIIEDCSVNAAHPRPYEFRSGTEMALLRTRLHGLLAGCAG